MKTFTGYPETIFEKAWRQGFEEGFREGFEEGRLNLILKFLKQRFGDLSLEIENNVKALSETGFDQLIKAFFKLTSQDELVTWLDQPR